MMNEERVREEIEKLTQAKMNLMSQLAQTEGALSAMQVVLDPSLADLPAEPDAEEE